MTFAIRGMGTAVPETALTQEEALGIARVLCCRSPEQCTWVPPMYAQTGINRRHTALSRAVVEDVLNGTCESGSVFLPSADPDDAGPSTGQRMRIYAAVAGPLALRAAADALAHSGLSPADVSHLVTVSCTGFAAPGIDLTLIEGLGLAPTVQRTHVGFMGCHAALNGLRVAAAFTGADPSAAVLLCAVELASLHYHYGWDPQKVIANALFADGAAAVVGVHPLTPTPLPRGERGFLPPLSPRGRGAGGEGERETASGRTIWRVRATGSCLLPDSADAMTWTIGDHGFEMTLSKKVPRLIARHLRPWLTEWLGGNGVSPEAVASWAIHPGGPRILEAVEEGLGLRREATADSRAVFAEYGNMSSPTVLFILDRLRRRGAPPPCVALGFGPGLVAEAVLFE